MEYILIGLVLLLEAIRSFPLSPPNLHLLVRRSENFPVCPARCLILTAWPQTSDT